MGNGTTAVVGFKRTGTAAIASIASIAVIFTVIIIKIVGKIT